MRRPQGVRWVSAVPGDGFGDAALAYVTALDQAGVPVTWTPLGWVRGLPRVVPGYDGPGAHLANRALAHDTVVVHLPAGGHDGLGIDLTGRRKVAYTTWESDHVPDGWVDRFGEFDAVLVPSEFNRASLRASGSAAEVHVVPHCAREVGEPAPLVLDRLADRFTFYTIGTWSTRKAMAETVDAFLDAFGPRDDVALVVKTSREDSQAVLRTRRGLPGGGPAGLEVAVWPTVAALLGRRTRIPEVHLIAEHVSPAEIDALHARGDCFVSLTRSEGWGLCIADAVLFGNPVVVTGWGGQLDYLGHDYPLLVDYDLVPTMSDPEDDWFPFCPGHRWARARHDHAVDVLRWVVDHPQEAAVAARRVGARLRRECAPDKVAARLIQALAPPA